MLNGASQGFMALLVRKTEKIFRLNWGQSPLGGGAVCVVCNLGFQHD